VRKRGDAIGSALRWREGQGGELEGMAGGIMEIFDRFHEGMIEIVGCSTFGARGGCDSMGLKILRGVPGVIRGRAG